MNHPRRDPHGLSTDDPTLGTESPLTKYDALQVLQGIALTKSPGSCSTVIEDTTARNATETNYAFESCKLAYEAAQVEAANPLGDLRRFVSVKHGKLLASHFEAPQESMNDGQWSKNSHPRASLLALKESSADVLIAGIEKMPVGNSTFPQQAHYDNLKTQAVQDLTKSAPLVQNRSQIPPINVKRFSIPLGQFERASGSLYTSRSNGTSSSSRPEVSNAKLDSLSSTRASFQDHTRHKRSNSRPTLNEVGQFSPSPAMEGMVLQADMQAKHLQAVELSKSEVIGCCTDFRRGKAHEYGTQWMPFSETANATPRASVTVVSAEDTDLKSTLLERFHHPVGVPPHVASIYSGTSGAEKAEQAASSLVHNPTGVSWTAPLVNHSTGSIGSPEPSNLVQKHQSHLHGSVGAGHLADFNFRQLVPEVLPPGYTNITFLSTPEARRSSQMQHLGCRLAPIFTAVDVAQLAQDRSLPSILRTVADGWPMYARVFKPRPLQVPWNSPPICSPSSDAETWRYDLPIEVLVQTATQYLSSEDVRNLRLVNKGLCALFSPIYFRNIVTRFGPDMFAPTQQYGNSINKHGISFEVDLALLGRAQKKVAEEVQEAFWGTYEWPKPAYQRFAHLKALEDLVDENAPLLKKTLQNLPIASELALSIDSGHGWLNGPDLSDMQLWQIRHDGSKVFGKTFKAANRWQEHLRNELFLWAQQNTINQTTKFLVERASTDKEEAAFNRTRTKLRWLRNIQCRPYNSFELVLNQGAELSTHHTGGTPPPPPAANHHLLAANAQNLPVQPPPNPLLLVTQPGFPVIGGAYAGFVAGPAFPPPVQLTQTTVRRRTGKARWPHRAQWPLIFNGYNLDAEVGGENKYIQDKIANPLMASLKPGRLSEAQAQFLMETVWAQRAFLSAYTTSVILNKTKLHKIHTLSIAKLSSGLLPGLEQDEFWRALPGLENLTIIISPDWRQEHIPGDKSFQTNMLVSPVRAAAQFTSFLRRYICKLEHLSNLTIGYVGGGENAPGLMARNQHVLPAPITQESRKWLSDHRATPPGNTMITFDHIKELKFVNCWFSPCMLLAFMKKARDTSLHHLSLESVSLTAHGASSVSATAPTRPIPTLYGEAAWLNETLPNDGCWPALLDQISPGLTFLEQKQAIGFHLSGTDQHRLRNKSFRGNVQTITLNSCGYAHISGVPVGELNQTSLLAAQQNSLDRGLRERLIQLETGQPTPRPFSNANLPSTSYLANARSLDVVGNRLMLGTSDARGREYFGLGTLTQAVHPVEKRVLEQGWNMRFGWGDDLKRWSAVDDGYHVGGTGRFSGKVCK